MKGYVTKNDFEKALRAHKAANDEMKSDQRDAAAADLSARASLVAEVDIYPIVALTRRASVRYHEEESGEQWCIKCHRGY